jgi:nucleotidyltransferase/DNA polymerase involved in DNA repair
MPQCSSDCVFQIIPGALISKAIKATNLQVSGEDLTPYRNASKAILSILRRFGPVQRGGMDEAFLDATNEVNNRDICPLDKLNDYI